jgi:hypothetical protein
MRNASRSAYANAPHERRHDDTVDNLTLFSKEVLPRLAELG